MSRASAAVLYACMWALGAVLLLEPPGGGRPHPTSIATGRAVLYGVTFTNSTTKPMRVRVYESAW